MAICPKHPDTRIVEPNSRQGYCPACERERAALQQGFMTALEASRSSGAFIGNGEARNGTLEKQEFEPINVVKFRNDKELARARALISHTYVPSADMTRAIGIANRVLDEPGRDPDDDISTVSRQFMRALDHLGCVFHRQGDEPS